MSRNHRRTAFTLIEVLIVVIIMAVLAATIIPQFSSSTKDAKESSLQFNLHTIRSQIQMYKVHHNNVYPESGTFADQMTQATDIDGKTGVASTPYGPYITGQIPVNPFNDDNTVVAVVTEGTEPTAKVNDTDGWQYDQSTGGFYPNNAEAYLP